MKKHSGHRSGPSIKRLISPAILSLIMQVFAMGIEPYTPLISSGEEGQTTPLETASNSPMLVSGPGYSRPKRIGIGNWLTFAANLDMSYRKTQFFQAGHNTALFQGDSRAELWLPPGRDDFSWGPYLRFARVESNRDYEWENNWGARPGFGFQLYPLSARSLRENDNLLIRLLGPLHVFAEHNKVYYKGKEHAWRPDEQVRIGVDYWREINVHDISKPWWGEIWNGLIWHSTNGFDKDYDTLIFANSLRIGVRKPHAGILSTMSPYVAFESSLSENGRYFWENRLLSGAGVRFSVPRKNLAKEYPWLDRLVIYTEYLVPLAYYRSSAPSSLPDHDFRVGINIVIGEWWYK